MSADTRIDCKADVPGASGRGASSTQHYSSRSASVSSRWERWSSRWSRGDRVRRPGPAHESALANPEAAGARPAILATLYLGVLLIAFTVPSESARRST